jgi:LysM repeat protein
MKSYLIEKAFGLILALNLVACAHEIPMGNGDLTERESSESEMTEEQIANQLWDDQGEREAPSVADRDSASDSLGSADSDTVAKLDEVSDGLNSDTASDMASETESDTQSDTEPSLDKPSAIVAAAEAPSAASEKTVASEAVVAQFKQVPQQSAENPVAAAAPAVETKNRYYVVRAGDTAEYVSMLIYKNTQKASKLVAWNGPSEAWAAGKVLYYVSPVKPRDKRILSFYEERQLPSEMLTVQSGDSLAALAEKRLGSSLSAKEIALVNGLSENENLKPGQVLKLYPSPLLGAQTAPATTVAAAAVAVPSEAKGTPTVLEKSNSVRGPAIITLAPAAATDAKPKVSLASSVMSTLLNHHPLVLACTLLVLTLFGIFFYMQRKRGGSPYDF